MKNKNISPSDLIKTKQHTSCYILDVRNPDEFQACHLAGAINLPLDLIEQGKTDTIPQDQPVYLVCQSGMRTERARKLLEAKGYNNLVCIEGGMNACSQISGAVIQNSKRLPLMRQVQIAAGSLVVIGIILSKLLHPAFVYLSLFVGSGLIFAGSTGFCGMAILLEKMPWNHIEQKQGGSCDN